MLRNDAAPHTRFLGLMLVAVVGVACALLIQRGNPGNMGVCGACFLRDVAGSVRLHQGPAIFRPEVIGVMLGALLLAMVSRKPFGRSGSHAVTRFVFGIWMAFAALVFLGCPFRMLQRLGGGDLNAWMALPGFVVGVGLALFVEKRGYNIGKTSQVPALVGLLGPLSVAALLWMFIKGGLLAGPGPGDVSKPPHAPWLMALVIAAIVGALLSATGFCAITAARQVFQKSRWMLVGAAALIAGYAITSLITGQFHASTAGQPIAHGDWLWNTLSLLLLGLSGAFAGGCPVRQMVMAGEGNGDAFVTVAGIAVGGALAHNLGFVSAAMSETSAGGATPAAHTMIVVGIVFSLLYALLISLRK